MKKNVRNRIPVFLMNCAWLPHVLQRQSSEVSSEPQKNTLVPIISMIETGYQPCGNAGKKQIPPLRKERSGSE